MLKHRRLDILQIIRSITALKSRRSIAYRVLLKTKSRIISILQVLLTFCYAEFQLVWEMFLLSK